MSNADTDGSGAPDLAAWDALVRKTLKGRGPESLARTVGGVALQALSVQAPGPVVVAGRAGPWQARQEIRTPSLKTAGKLLRSDLQRGVEAPWLRVDAATRLGVRPDDAPRSADLALLTRDDLAGVLRGVDVASVPVVIEAGCNGLALLGALLAVATDAGVAPADLKGTVQADPIGTLARDGVLPRGVDAAWDDVAAMMRFADSQAPHLKVLALSTLPFVEAGADAATEVGVAVASLVEALRRLDARGLAADTVLRHTELTVSLTGDVLADLGTLRAVRSLWSRVAVACGASAAAARPFVHARVADAVLSGLDPWTNVLRCAAAGFAGAAGGADALTLLPHDNALGVPEAQARRIAGNLHLLLREEASLDRVQDPVAGSYALESLADGLARAGYAELQAIEGGGGLLQVLSDGTLPGRIQAQAQARAARVASRKQGLVGVSLFPDTAEPAPSTRPFDVAQHDRGLQSRWEAAALAATGTHAAVQVRLALDALRTGLQDRVEPAANAAALGVLLAQVAGAVHGHPFRVQPLSAARWSAPWESLRARVQAAGHGIFLANLGPMAAHKAREEFARNLFVAGGFGVSTNEGFEDPDAAAVAFGIDGPRAACLCGTDSDYEHIVPGLARKLRAAGADAVVVAGRWPDDPGPWQEAGVTHVVHLGAPVLDVLNDLATAMEAP